MSSCSPKNNRQWRPPAQDEELYRVYREAAAASPVVSLTVCHAPYLINVISPDAVTRERSFSCLVDNLRAATALGAIGLVIHPGSHRGAEAASATRRIAEKALNALDEASGAGGRVCDLLLENAAGTGGTVGRTFSELAEIIDAAGGDPRIGVCLDTQHLWASGVSFVTPARADRVVADIDARVGLERLRCLHANDSKVALGANRDRHENPGQGTIGGRGLASILGHPDLQGLPAVLEVRGVEGHGPGPADLAVARDLHARGIATRRRRQQRRERAAPHGSQPREDGPERRRR